ncbi:MAG: GlsB/YeaQ/YmgE family stress response membrane protein [Anaerolineales bacterium]
MTIGGFLVLLLIAAICGAIAQLLVGYSAGGCIVSSAVGLVGALLGYWLARQLGLPLIFTVEIQGQTFPVVWSIVGAMIFVALVSLFRGPRRVRA